MQVDDLEIKPTPTTSSESHNSTTAITLFNTDIALDGVGKAVAIVNQRDLLTQANSMPCLISLERGQWLRVRKQLDPNPNPLRPQPLLVPLTFTVLENEREALERLIEPLTWLGIELKPRPSHKIMVMSVAQPLRQQNLQRLLPNLISYAASLAPVESSQCVEFLIDWLADHVVLVKSVYTLSEAIQLIAELEQLWQGQLPLDDPKFIQAVDFSATIAVLRT
jgi:DNA mismatch repair protein MutL